MQLKDLHIVYFIGIGGIGMSAIARWFNHYGIRVEGYDRTPTSLTDSLQEEGINVHFEDDIHKIPAEVFEKNALVVYTPAIPQEHKGLNKIKDAGVKLMKRSEVLGLITTNFFTVAVAGTHGKTTTSSMVAHILKYAGKDMTAFLGGIATNYNSNLIFNEGKGKDTIAVVEADEYDRSFLTLHPNVAVVTSADADHLDIYGEKHELEKSFKAFIGQIERSGILFINDSIADKLIEGGEDLNINNYGINRGQILASSIAIGDGIFRFNYRDKETGIEDIELGVPGFHNVENAVAAVAVSLSLGVSPDKIKAAIAEYKGVKRRFEYVLKSEDIVFIDDYAHHPVEITSFLKSVRSLYPEKKILVVFQPHLYTRTRDFAQGFAESLSLADEVVLLDIYPAREVPIPGVTSEIILEGITTKKSLAKDRDDLFTKIVAAEADVVTTVGAGDIDKLVQPIKVLLEGQCNVV